MPAKEMKTGNHLHEIKPPEPEKKFTINQIIKSPIQLLFLVFTTISCLGLIPFTYFGFKECMYNNNNAP